MCLKRELAELLGRKPSQTDIAGHIADSISAQQQLRSSFLRGGDIESAVGASSNIANLRRQAQTFNLDRDNYPGLYRD